MGIIKGITIVGGVDKEGNREKYQNLEIKLGETLSIVGLTGSGKTILISDIEMLAQGDTVSKRKILVDGAVPNDEIRYVTRYKPVTMITQNTKCISDLTVMEFLSTHCAARGLDCNNLCYRVVKLANSFVGEEIKYDSQVTTLSGGQTRALLIADAILVGSAQVLILDEIENAGINKEKVISILNTCAKDKILIFVTHDPCVALLCKRRLVMKNGTVNMIKEKSEDDEKVLHEVLECDKKISEYREKIRNGEW